MPSLHQLPEGMVQSALVHSPALFDHIIISYRFNTLMRVGVVLLGVLGRRAPKVGGGGGGGEWVCVAPLLEGFLKPLLHVGYYRCCFTSFEGSMVDRSLIVKHITIHPS
jgi:hypothetical protein